MTQDIPPPVYRITGAAPSRSSDLDRRITRYLISMAVRTACVIGVFVVPGPARWVLAVGAIFLPYIAVLLANASDHRRDTAPEAVTPRGLGTADAAPDAAGADPDRAREEPRVLPGEILYVVRHPPAPAQRRATPDP